MKAALPRVTLAFGTRPEAIKMAPVVRAFRADARFAPRVVVTGQHRQMLDAVLATFEIVPDADLNVMTPNQSLAGLTARTLTAFDAELRAHPADLVLVPGEPVRLMTLEARKDLDDADPAIRDARWAGNGTIVFHSRFASHYSA